MTLSGFLDELCMAMARNLGLRDLLQLSTTCIPFSAICLHVADTIVSKDLDGLEGCSPWMQAHTTHNVKLRRIWLAAALRPYCLVRQHRGRMKAWLDMTIPFRISLDTQNQSPLCLEFRMIAAKAANGSFKVGLIDAEAASVAALEASDYWSGDLSRGQADSDLFAIAFDPADGTLTATTTAIKGKNIVRPTHIRRRRKYYTAALTWDVLGDSTQKWNSPREAALVVDQGNLTFFRMWPDGSWESSGVVCDNLPQKVLPCVFMSSFIGYAQVNFIRMWNSTPDVCAEAAGHGLVSGWRRSVA